MVRYQHMEPIFQSYLWLDLLLSYLSKARILPCMLLTLHIVQLTRVGLYAVDHMRMTCVSNAGILFPVGNQLRATLSWNDGQNIRRLAGQIMTHSVCMLPHAAVELDFCSPSDYAKSYTISIRKNCEAQAPNGYMGRCSLDGYRCIVAQCRFLEWEGLRKA
jgi:hypothetical protein